MIKKIENFVMENYKLLIPIGFMCVLFIAAISYYGASVSSNYRVSKEENVYQYFYGRRYEYKALVSKNKKDVIVGFEPINIKVNLDSSPIYLDDKKTVILPKDMSVVMPTMSCAEYLSPGYSYIKYKKGLYMLVTNRYNKALNHYFFYDGKDTYFFIDSVNLVINGEKVVLSPYSYIIAQYNNYLSYYDFKSDTFKTVNIDSKGAFIENEYYKVLVDRDIIDYQGQNVILTSRLDKLNTIDKKG